jgi:hypothetical protein
MFERQRKLSSALKEVYSPEEIQKILNYKISEEEFNNVASIGRQLLRTIPILPLLCASMSAKWYEFIRFNTSIPVCVVTGHLEIHNEPVFSQTASIYSLLFDGETFEDWDGHCWIEFGGYIGDISILRTVNSQNFPHQNVKKWFSRFGADQECIIGKAKTLEAGGLFYIPVSVLTEFETTKLVDMLHNTVLKSV